MARTHYRQSLSVADRLFCEGSTFSFFQAVRLLRRLSAITGKRVVVKPCLNMDFPGRDISRIEDQGDAYLIEVSFLSLYGSGSPLPSFYTEELFDQDREDNFTTKAFLDVFQQRLYELFFDGCAKHSVSYQLSEVNNSRLLDVIYSMSGIGLGELAGVIQKNPKLTKYMGLWSSRSRSISNLKLLLGDYLELPVSIESYYVAEVPISNHQHNALGACNATLGQDCYLGSVFTSVSGNILIRIGPVERHDFNALMVGGVHYEAIKNILSFFMNRPLRCFLEVTLASGECEPFRLGCAPGNGLGQKTWLTPKGADEVVQVVLAVE